MEKEKVEVLGMIFDKENMPEVGNLSVTKDGTFFGKDADEQYLENIKSYVEDGTEFINCESQTFKIYSSKYNEWL